MISINQDASSDNPNQSQQFTTHPTNSDGTKNKRITINSLESLRYAMQEGSSSTMKQKNSSQKKSGNLPLKENNQLSSGFKNSEFESLSEINSMDQSSLEFGKLKTKNQPMDEFEMEVEEDDKSDSPQKLRKKIKKFQMPSKLSLLGPPPDLWQKSYQFMNQQYAQIESETQKNILILEEFLLSPLPAIQNSYMRYIFEIHLFKYTFTFNTCYEFYMRNSEGDMIHLARSQKDSLTVSSSHLLYASNPHKSGDKKFIAKLKYNTVKSEYNLYDIDEKEQPNQPRRLLATGLYEKPLGDERDIKLYIPKPQFMHNDYIKSETNKNMLSFYNENESPIYRKVEKLRTVSIPKENEAKVREQFELKNEGRRILAVNEEGSEKFYMGKKQNERYVIIAAGGITPLQVFTMAIVNLDH